MAGTIKGMTIEIGGNTAPLEQALKGVNKEIKGTQSELKEVERLLKLDPKNTELLEQKQKLLGDQINNTKTKLDALKQAQKQLDTEMKNGGEVNQQEYRKLQREIISTEDKLKSYNKELQETGDKYDLLGKRAGAMNEAMQKASLGVLALGGALVKSAFDSANLADELNTLSAQTGLSTEEIQKFKYASDIIDVSFETLAGSMAKLTKNMASASKGSGDTYEAFKSLGVSITDANGELRSNQDVFDETINALGKMENETQRDALAMQIFGKSAQDLNPLIKGGAEQLKDLGEEAEQMGIIMSQDTLDGANALQDSLDKLKASASGAFTSIGADMAQYLIPVIEGLRDLVKWILDNKSAILTTLASISAGILAFNMVTMIQGMVQAFQAWRVATEGMTVAQALLNAVMNANPVALVVTAIATLTTALVTLTLTNEDFREKVLGAWEMLKQGAINVWEAIVKFFTIDIPNAFNATVTFLQTAWQNVVEFIKAPIMTAINFLTTVITTARDWGSNLIKAIGEGINNALSWLGDVISSVWNYISEAFTSHFKGIINIGKFLIEGLWNGIKNVKDWLINKIKSFCSDALGAIKAFFGIESPSKVMANEVGNYMAEGIGVGFGRTIPSVIDAMKDKLSGVTDAMQTELSFGDIPQIQGNQIISENQYVTRNYTNTIETIRQPQTVELVLDGTKLARTLIQPLDNEYNRLGVKI